MGTAGTLIGAVVGFTLALLLALSSYGSGLFAYVAWGDILQRAVLAVVVGSFLSLIGGILPAYRAAKMEPVDAMALEV